ncbi:MAG: hypothetical protein HRU18_01840 [Pseudoalteromonas sp.]|uniref:hypothetical protein n=1 Tax=Pseudoalteromonas sp. TaxID=53249 RepID=UPI001D775A70|nr:hypothetical protein [Pseudoalteromonas sp.]NRA76924.1 hypothetical protein [Pseudoalteromonas sp.]
MNLAQQYMNMNEKKEPKWYSKASDIVSELADQEAMRSRVYRLTDGESDNLEGDKDIDLPYYWSEDGAEAFLHGTGNHNLDFWNEFIKLDGAVKFIEDNWKISYGESGGMMPHSDANAPDGAVVMLFAGEGHDEEFMVDIQNIANEPDMKKLMKKEKISLKALAHFFLNQTDTSYMKPEYSEQDIEKAKKDSDIEELEMYGYVPADIVVAVYVDGKKIEKFLKDAGASQDMMDEVEDISESKKIKVDKINLAKLTEKKIPSKLNEEEYKHTDMSKGKLRKLQAFAKQTRKAYEFARNSGYYALEKPATELDVTLGFIIDDFEKKMNEASVKEATKGKSLAEAYMELCEEEVNEFKLPKFKNLKKLLKKFKPFKKIKKSKDAFNKDLAKKKQAKGFWKKLFEGINEDDSEKKIEALAKHLGIEKDEVEESSWGFEADGGEYEVLTDDEAGEKLKEYIEQSVWAFNADFLQSHWGSQEDINNSLGLESSYYDEDAEEDVEIEDADEVFYLNMGMSLEEWISSKQNEAEGANDDFMKLIQDFDEFVSDAESADGRGHFLSGYDDEEHEVDDLYIYRTN